MKGIRLASLSVTVGFLQRFSHQGERLQHPNRDRNGNKFMINETLWKSNLVILEGMLHDLK